MTDYTSDTYNDNYSSAYDDNEVGESSEWQEFWDEQAQGKYWYNNISGNRIDVCCQRCSFHCCDFYFHLLLFLISFVSLVYGTMVSLCNHINMCHIKMEKWKTSY